MKFPASSASGQNIGSYGFDHAEAAPNMGIFWVNLLKISRGDFGYFGPIKCVGTWLFAKYS